MFKFFDVAYVMRKVDNNYIMTFPDYPGVSVSGVNQYIVMAEAEKLANGFQPPATNPLVTGTIRVHLNEQNTCRVTQPAP